MRNSSVKAATGLLLLLCATFLLLWPGVHGPFLFDDYPNLKNLAELGSQPTLRSVGAYLSLFPGESGRPLAALSFLLNDFSWPSDPYGFKVTNLLIHLLNGVLVFGLARKLGQLVAPKYEPAGETADFTALACAALWLLSPIQVSAVFLTVQRMTELAATFLFAGLWGFIVILNRARQVWGALLALLVLATGTALAFLCKENGALAPLLALVLCATLLRPTTTKLSRSARGIIWTGLLVPSAAVFYVLLQRVLRAPEGFYTGRNFGLWERLMTENRVLIDYVNLIIAPRLSSSSLYNDNYQISQGLLEPWTTLPAILLITSAFTIALWCRRKRPMITFAVLWFLAGHAIESTVVALEIYFEHRNYVPLFGPAFAVAHATTNARGKLRKPAQFGLMIWLALASGITYLQARTWGDEERLATYWHLERPDSLRAQQQYAQYLYKNGRISEAREVMDSLQEKQASPFDAMVQVLTLDCDAAQTIPPETFDRAVQLAAVSRHTPGTALILARMRKSVQRGNCLDQLTVDDWLHLTERAISGSNGRGIRRMIRVERAELYLAMDDLDAAIEELGHAYGRGRRAEPRVAFYAAALLATAGNYDLAREWARRPLELPWTWKRWLAQTDRQAHELLDAIDESEREAARQ